MHQTDNSLLFCHQRINDREKELSRLYQKQGRATQFPNKAARDKWLQNEIDQLQSVCATNVAQV
jgi:structural maintenance of chromosome 3 (chondroitin sulfate proteoglycan 6)